MICQMFMMHALTFHRFLMNNLLQRSSILNSNNNSLSSNNKVVSRSSSNTACQLFLQRCNSTACPSLRTSSLTSYLRLSNPLSYSPTSILNRQLFHYMRAHNTRLPILRQYQHLLSQFLPEWSNSSQVAKSFLCHNMLPLSMIQM